MTKPNTKQIAEPLSEEEQAFANLVTKTVSNVVRLKLDEGKLSFAGEKSDNERTLIKLAKMFGTTDYKPSVWLLNQLANLDESVSESPDYVQHMLHMIDQINPQDPIEGMLATQMVATQSLVLDAAKRAGLSKQSFEGRQANMNYCFKLMGTFTKQMDALNKHRGKGRQKMTVEHVHVNEGGQAVIGSVEGGKK